MQQALPWGMVAQLYYDGSVGRHLEVESNINQVTGATSAIQVHPFTVLAATSPVVPGGAIASNIGYRTSNSFSNYNAMWAALSKNMSNGIEIKMNYEWTKSLDLNSLGSQGGLTLPDSTNPFENYGLSDFNVRQHFAGTAIYDLPFHGNRLVSGYQLSSIFQYQTGNPVNIIAGSSSFNGVTGLPRPTQLGPSSARNNSWQESPTSPCSRAPDWRYGGTICDINERHLGLRLEILGTQASATATTPTVYTALGTMQRNAFTGPGFADLDMSGEKDTKICESLSFTLRADAFDILNHPNFGQPSGNVQSSSFGQITSTRFAISDGGSSRQLQISGKFIF